MDDVARGDRGNAAWANPAVAGDEQAAVGVNAGGLAGQRPAGGQLDPDLAAEGGAQVLVFGGETDFQYSGINGSLSTSCPAATCLVPVSASYDQKVHWFGTVRGRAGYAQDGWLIYATGGYAYARLETTATASAGGASASLSQNDNRNGWTVGGGIEVALTSHWSAKAEYLYMNFGSHTTTWPVPGLPSLTDNTKLDMNVVRAGVNYRF